MSTRHISAHKAIAFIKRGIYSMYLLHALAHVLLQRARRYNRIMASSRNFTFLKRAHTSCPLRMPITVPGSVGTVKMSLAL